MQVRQCLLESQTECAAAQALASEQEASLAEKDRIIAEKEETVVRMEKALWKMAASQGVAVHRTGDVFKNEQEGEAKWPSPWPLGPMAH